MYVNWRGIGKSVFGEQENGDRADEGEHKDNVQRGAVARVG